CHSHPLLSVARGSLQPPGFRRREPFPSDTWRRKGRGRPCMKPMRVVEWSSRVGAAAEDRKPSTLGRAVRSVSRRTVIITLGAIALLGVGAYFVHNAAGGDGFSFVDASIGDWAYPAIFLLVF